MGERKRVQFHAHIRGCPDVASSGECDSIRKEGNQRDIVSQTLLKGGQSNARAIYTITNSQGFFIMLCVYHKLWCSVDILSWQQARRWVLGPNKPRDKHVFPTDVKSCCLATIANTTNHQQKLQALNSSKLLNCYLMRARTV